MINSMLSLQLQENQFLPSWNFQTDVRTHFRLWVSSVLHFSMKSVSTNRLFFATIFSDRKLTEPTVQLYQF